jgi:hypothetical protein
MQKTFMTLFLLFSLSSYGQQGMWKPFKLLVVQPDTAIVGKSFKSEEDSIEASNPKTFYATLKDMQSLISSDDLSKQQDSITKEALEQLKTQIAFMKAKEAEMKRFKYFQIISQYSSGVYNFYFNEYKPFSTIEEIPKQKTDLLSLETLADTANADYIVFYSNIHTVENGNLPVLKLTTFLYSKEENKIILGKETEGDTNSRGDMWTCNTMLSCLLINAVRTSTDAVAGILRKRQARSN